MSLRGRSNEQGRAAPSPEAVPSKVICGALAPPVGETFLLESSVSSGPSARILLS